MKPSAHLLMNRPFARAALLASLGLVSMAAQAEIYKIVGPDGKVTFSDKPPVMNKPAAPVTASAAPAAAGLPAELQKATSAHPARLFTQANCTPCDSARTWLKTRGIPFTERTVSSQADFNAFAKVTDKTVLPVLTLGAQVLTGFNSAQWNQYLDAADYPKKSVLPKNYQFAPATPLATAPANNGADGAGANGAGTDEPAEPPVEAPAGIRF